MEIRYKALLRSRDLRPRPHLVALQRVCFFDRGKSSKSLPAGGVTRVLQASEAVFTFRHAV